MGTEVEEQILKSVQIVKRQMNDLIKENERQALEIAKLKRERFVRFSNEECWVYAGDGSDNLETLVCPVVIDPTELMHLVDLANKAAHDTFRCADDAESERAVGVDKLRKMDVDVTLHSGYVKVQAYINDEYVKPFVQMLVEQGKAE